MRAFVTAARRTAVAPRGGGLAALGIEALAAPVMLALLADAGLEPGQVDEVICSEAIGLGGNPARRIALAAGLPGRVAGLSIDRQCAGGLDAIALAAAMVAAGRAQVVVAGGVESHSRRPQRLRDGVPYDQAPFTPWPARDPDMAVAADLLGRRLKIGREEQDAWAVESHRRALAVAAWPEILALNGLARDSFTRRLTPATAARAPAIAGAITAANAAVAADAAAFAVVVAPHLARGRSALRLRAAATLGGDPAEPGLAPVAAIAAALGEAGLTPGDLAQVELMEAYAVQAIACVRAAGFDPARVNPRGGGLARGHPIGASGAVLAVRLFHDLTGGGGGPGLAAIAAAGGIGSALVLAP